MTSYEQYDLIDAVRWSKLKAMAVSPKQYRFELERTKSETPALRIGRAFHAYVLEPEIAAEQFVCYPARRQGGKWEAFAEENADRTILTEAEFLQAHGCAAAVLANPIARAYLSGGFREATITWTDEATGLPCKGRVDLLGQRLIDLKSAARIEPRMFEAACVRLGYVGQLAFYQDGLRANGVTVADEPVLISVESVPPHDVLVYRVPKEVVEVGRAEYHRLLEQLKACMEDDRWPGRAEDELELHLPSWATQQDALELVMDDGEVLRV